MQQFTLCLDVGGTELKGAAVENGVLVSPVMHFPANANFEKEPLIDHFCDVFRKLNDSIPAPHTITGLRLAFPGPFDYENGISLLQGLDKYDTLYQVNLREELYKRLSDIVSQPNEIKFINDVAAFALGEMNFGSAVNTDRSISVCIGTGCGSAFGLGNQLAPEGTQGMPKDGYIYPFPFLDGCIDDHIPKRGLMQLTAQRMGEPLEGAQLAKRAAQGEQAALDCFAEFGVRLRDALQPFLLAYSPDCLCLGGQVTRSFSLFGKPLSTLCQKMGITLHIATDTSERAIQGLYVL